MQHEMDSIDPIIAKPSHLFPRIENLVNMDFVGTGLAGRNARSLGYRFDWDDFPSTVVDMAPRLEFLYKVVELFAVELFVQCLRFAAKKVQLPKSILR